MKLIIVLFVMLLSFDALAANCGRITSLRGVIEVLRLKSESGKSENRVGIIAKKKMKLLCSDIILTRRSARAKVRLVNKTMLTLGPNSRVEIRNHFNKDKSYNYLKLTYGKVRAIFKKGKSKIPNKLPSKKSPRNKSLSRLVIKTPSVVAGVRGTDFYVAYSPNRKISEQATLSGSVEVKNEVTGEKLIVKPGKQVAVKRIKDDIAEKIKRELKSGKNINQLKESLKLAPLKVTPIKEELKTDIRQTSAIARNDKNFTTNSAVKILGKPKTWKLPPDEIPLDLKDIKEEF